MLNWIQEKITGMGGDPFPTLADVYSTATQQSQKDSPDERRWARITPRTLMFRDFFNSLTSMSSHVQIVETLHRCGFTNEVLDTLPEAIATPLRDAISMCQSHPPPTWSKGLLTLVDRTDISAAFKPDRLFRHNTVGNSVSVAYQYSLRIQTRAAGMNFYCVVLPESMLSSPL